MGAMFSVRRPALDQTNALVCLRIIHIIMFASRKPVRLMCDAAHEFSAPKRERFSGQIRFAGNGRRQASGGNDIASTVVVVEPYRHEYAHSTLTNKRRSFESWLSMVVFICRA